MKGRQAGFTLVEVMLVVGIIGITTALASPMFLSYYQSAQLRTAAEQVVTYLNQGRQMAITQNGSICVHMDSTTTPTTLHYHQGTCTGAPLVLPGTDAAGNIPLPLGITAAATASPIFNYLGGSSTGATWALTHTPSTRSLNVVVALSGRVCIAANTITACS
jgi:prepilin-type N-terminal cleavage/methylation domain-containing protein